MTKEELLLSEGAWYHCARMIYKNQDIGLKPEGSDLVLFAEGEEVYARLSNITDVEVKPVRAKKAKVEDAPVAAQIDDILG